MQPKRKTVRRGKKRKPLSPAHKKAISKALKGKKKKRRVKRKARR